MLARRPKRMLPVVAILEGGLAQDFSPPIHVACAADANYALPLSVMLQSLGAHLSPGRRAEVYILADGLDDGLQARVQRSVPDNLTLHWCAPVPLDPSLPLWGRMSSTTYQKLTLADWLPPDLPRVLWLDCDMLILADVSSLWDTAIGDDIALAVPDERVPLVSARFGVAAWQELNLARDAPHFNAGLLLVNLEAWRAQQVSARSFDYLRQYRERVYFWDQEALNAVLSGHWRPLDARWNRHPAYSPASEQPWILHFSGDLKPWLFEGRNHHRAQYGQYLARTDWAGTPLSRSWRDACLERYETTRLRRALLLPLEQTAMILRRSLTRT